MKDYEAAAEWARNAIRANPDLVFPHYNLAASLGQLGLSEEAAEALKAGLAIHPSPTLEFFTMGWPSKDPANLQHILDGMRKAGLSV